MSGRSRSFAQAAINLSAASPEAHLRASSDGRGARAQMNQILEAVQTTFELQQEVDAGLVQMAVRDTARSAAQARCGTSD